MLLLLASMVVCRGCTIHINGDGSQWGTFKPRWEQGSQKGLLNLPGKPSVSGVQVWCVEPVERRRRKPYWAGAGVIARAIPNQPGRRVPRQDGRRDGRESRECPHRGRGSARTAVTSLLLRCSPRPVEAHQTARPVEAHQKARLQRRYRASRLNPTMLCARARWKNTAAAAAAGEQYFGSKKSKQEPKCELDTLKQQVGVMHWMNRIGTV
ncbi:unnamed protein product [Boreogadus saida]